MEPALTLPNGRGSDTSGRNDEQCSFLLEGISRYKGTTPDFFKPAV